MTDSESAALGWVCPACQRRVPRKVSACRCGHVLEAIATPVDATFVRDEPRSRSAAIVRIALVGALAIAGTVWLWQQQTAPAGRPRGLAAPAAATAQATPAST